MGLLFNHTHVKNVITFIGKRTTHVPVGIVFLQFDGSIVQWFSNVSPCFGTICQNTELFCLDSIGETATNNFINRSVGLADEKIVIHIMNSIVVLIIMIHLGENQFFSYVHIGFQKSVFLSKSNEKTTDCENNEYVPRNFNKVT